MNPSARESKPVPNISSVDADSQGAGDAIARYQSELEIINSKSERLVAKDRLIGKVRITLFIAAIVFWIVGYTDDRLTAAIYLGWLMLAAFFVAATLNEPIRDSIEELKRHRSVFERLIARLRRDWDALATKRLTHQLSLIELVGHRREVAGDLDLLGRASLFHLVSMAATTPGIRTLAEWLSGPAVAGVAIQRAAAVEALAPMREQRLRFYTLAREVGDSTGDPERFTQWATGDLWLKHRGWLTGWATVSVVLSCLLIAGVVCGAILSLPVIVFKASLVGLVVLIIVNLLITTLVLSPAHQIFSIAMANRGMVHDYEEIFSAADWLPVGESGPTTQPDDLLGRIRRRMVEGDRCAVEGMRALQRVARAGGLRQSAGTFLLYLPLQAFGLWDVWVLRRLENWQAEYCDDVAQWFESLGELEALVSIAALRDEYPRWARATWVADPDQATVKATAIGHPLLTDAARVQNDVQVGPPGTLLLVTGSNMSGKSTMLRSIGLNVALAGIGAPVCRRLLKRRRSNWPPAFG